MTDSQRAHESSASAPADPTRGTGAYRVELEKDGCERCSHGREYVVVGPDDVAMGVSFEQEETAEDLAGYMNIAYHVGQQTQLEKPTRGTGEMTDCIRDDDHGYWAQRLEIALWNKLGNTWEVEQSKRVDAFLEDLLGKWRDARQQLAALQQTHDALLVQLKEQETNDQTRVDGPATVREDSPTAATNQPIRCVCDVEDGLVQEWVSKARAVALAKGLIPADSWEQADDEYFRSGTRYPGQ